ncbi:hypothetical protein [Lentzea albida]|uniref:Uncharacterized protein n=1 Tax=Lentzea albida TaxID=65499 RepID=A0A1H9BJ32_9PSEU|nr:hypothetical protein [Lentzea albida]SEP88986.1 hypothetical protein SAMN04488000_101567 [Lentzea albida]
MLSRTVVGAGAGILAGAGFALTLDGLTRYCYLRPGRSGCGLQGPVLYPPVFAFWMAVAGLLIWAGFRVVRQQRGWLATAIGSVLWVVLIVAVLWFRYTYLDLVQEDGHFFVLVAAVVVPCVAYGSAGMISGSRREVV